MVRSVLLIFWIVNFPEVTCSAGTSDVSRDGGLQPEKLGGGKSGGLFFRIGWVRRLPPIYLLDQWKKRQ